MGCVGERDTKCCVLWGVLVSGTNWCDVSNLVLLLALLLTLFYASTSHSQEHRSPKRFYAKVHLSEQDGARIDLECNYSSVLNA